MTEGSARTDGVVPRPQAAGLPPGQYEARDWPVLHYGRVPRFDPRRWDLRVMGATQSGAVAILRHADLDRLPRVEVVADLHCVTRFSLRGVRWSGIPAHALVDLVPPRAGVAHVMVWAEYGYSANVRLDDLLAPQTVLATHRDGAPLAPEHGWPLRLVVPHLYAWKGPKWVRAIEYLTADRRGFWEERGYHNRAGAWQEQRYAYQEGAADEAAAGRG